jgi:hypothetical protein
MVPQEENFLSDLIMGCNQNNDTLKLLLKLSSGYVHKVYINKRISCLDLGFIPKISHIYANIQNQKRLEPGVVTYTCNPQTKEDIAEGL